MGKNSGDVLAINNEAMKDMEVILRNSEETVRAVEGIARKTKNQKNVCLL